MNTRLSYLVGLTGALALAFSLGRGATPSPALAVIELIPLAPTSLLGAAFTVQGRVIKGGSPVTGSCDATFKLYDASASGAQVGGTVVSPTLQVSDGLFTIALDFGAGVFNGQARWMEMAIGCGEAPSALSPRTAVSASPYALYATRAGNVPATLFSPLLRPQTLDLAAVDAGLKGFHGGFTDGRYAYFVPNNNGSRDGKVARVDLQDFASSGVTSLDLAAVDAGLVGFEGGFTDGRYGYFVPYYNGAYNGKLARVDLQNFTTGGVTLLDLATVDSRLKGFVGGFTDGRYGYLAAYFDGTGISGKVARVDLQNFAIGGVTGLDLAAVDSGLKCFVGGFSDGRYGYFVPADNGSGCGGKVARVDLQNFTVGGVTPLDLTAVDAGLKGYQGGFTDGRYGYLVPYYGNGLHHGRVARIDLQNFTTGGVTSLDLAAVDAGLKGFLGGFTDGRYAYFVPFYTGSSYSGKLARVDLQNFTASGVTWLDMTATDAGLKGFWSGFTDGRHGYFAPYYEGGGAHGKVARIQLFASGAP